MKSSSLSDAPIYTDAIIPQNHESYTEEQHETWRMLHSRQTANLPEILSSRVLELMKKLQISGEGIPDFEKTNPILEALSGFNVVGVEGLVSDRYFFELLAQRKFPTTVVIRSRENLNYCPEPDVFHDYFGHVPLLADPDFAQFMEFYGQKGIEFIEIEKETGESLIPHLTKLYWYTVEFGLQRDADNRLSVYGAGIASSATESFGSVTSNEPIRVPFDIARIMRSDYLIDKPQSVYFVIDSIPQLMEAVRSADLLALAREASTKKAIYPGVLAPEDKELILPSTFSTEGNKFIAPGELCYLQKAGAPDLTNEYNPTGYPIADIVITDVIDRVSTKKMDLNLAFLSAMQKPTDLNQQQRLRVLGHFVAMIKGEAVPTLA